MSEFSFTDANPFAGEIEALSRVHAKSGPGESPVLFYGSSSIRLWSTLVQDFAPVHVLNHGFGGSTLAHCVHEMERLVFRVRPRAIVIYAGDNDIEQGASPEEVLAVFEQFITGVRERLGLVPVVFISIKPSPARFGNIAKISRANSLIAAKIATVAKGRSLDVSSRMLTSTGEPRRDLFSDDGLHVNAAGYRIWTSLVRDALAEFRIIL